MSSGEFKVEQAGDEVVIRVSGSAVLALLTILLRAKFATEPRAEALLSPYVNDALRAALAALSPDHMAWSAVTKTVDLDSPAFKPAVDELKAYRADEEPGAPIEALLERGLYPYRPG